MIPGDPEATPTPPDEPRAVATSPRWVLCDGCGRRFVALRTDHRYHSGPCRTRHWEKLHPRVGRTPRQTLLEGLEPVREVAAPPALEAPRLARHCRALLARLKEGPATNHELIGIAGHRFGARLKELKDKGHAYRIVERDHRTGRVVYQLEDEETGPC